MRARVKDGAALTVLLVVCATAPASPSGADTPPVVLENVRLLDQKIGGLAKWMLAEALAGQQNDWADTSEVRS